MEDIEDLGKAYCGHSGSFHEWQGAEEVGEIRSSLLSWYRVSRRRLPWRGDPAPYEEGDCNIKGGEAFEVSPYGTWVSEVMLQQTRVATVVAYYVRWMTLFPTVQALAAANPEEVKRAWAGLGYYRRARMLQSGAAMVVEKFGGELPSTREELQSIPGIGPYTAGAICSISFGQPEPVVDGNVIRVLSRLRAVHADPKQKALVDLCWSLAGGLVAPQDPGGFNQALMELGATVCTPQSPKCKECPVSGQCITLALVEKRGIAVPTRAAGDGPCGVCVSDPAIQCPENASDVPLKAQRPPPREQVLSVSAIRSSGGRWLMVQRPDKGLLAGQWELPSVIIQDGGQVGEGLEKGLEGKRKSEADALLRELGLEPCQFRERKVMGTIIHVFSHRRHTMLIESISLGSEEDDRSCVQQSGDRAVRWMSEDDMERVVVSTSMKKALALASKASRPGPRGRRCSSAAKKKK